VAAGVTLLATAAASTEETLLCFLTVIGCGIMDEDSCKTIGFATFTTFNEGSAAF